MLLLSDVHFGVNSQQEVDRILEAAADPAVTSQTIVIAGDLVQRATESEYSAASEFLKQLIELGNHVCVTPGNHDFQVSGFPDGWGTDKTNIVPARWDKARARYREHVLGPILSQPGVLAHGLDGDDEAFRYDMITRSGDDVFVCLRSTHRRHLGNGTLGFRSVGRIRKRQVAWARESLEALLPELPGARLHLVTHRSIWQSVGDVHPPLSKRKRVTTFMEEFGFQTYIHGHNHRFSFERIGLPHSDRYVRRLGVPSVCDRVDEIDRAFLSWSAERPDMLVSSTMEGRAQVDIVNTAELEVAGLHEELGTALEAKNLSEALRIMDDIDRQTPGGLTPELVARRDALKSEIDQREAAVPARS